jgi:hypothetical protein
MGAPFYQSFPIFLNQYGLTATCAFNVITLLNEAVLIISRATSDKLLPTKNL